MKPEIVLKHEFVEFIPSDLKAGTIYISIRFGTASHLCCCGCGSKVVTPLRPTDWKLIFDGKTVSLDPSIGNWSFACRSHYWIRNNRVQWAKQASQKEIAAIRAYDSGAKERYFSPTKTPNVHAPNANDARPVDAKPKKGVWKKLKKWFRVE